MATASKRSKICIGHNYIYIICLIKIFKTRYHKTKLICDKTNKGTK